MLLNTLLKNKSTQLITRNRKYRTSIFILVILIFALIGFGAECEDEAAGTIIFDQRHFRIFKDEGGLAAAPLASEDTNYSNAPTGKNLRIRFQVANTGTMSGNITRRLVFSENAGPWTQITTNTNNVRLSLSPNFADGDATVGRLTPTGTFVPGQGKESGSDTSLTSLLNGGYLEDEYSIKFETSAGGKSYQFRITNAGTMLNVYSYVPTITVAAAPLPPTTPSAPTITSPNGGERWLAGSSQNITWNASESGRSYQVEQRNLTQYDNFNDNSLDATKWTGFGSNGITVAETGSELKISGTSTTAASNWNGVNGALFATANNQIFQVKLKAATNVDPNSAYAFHIRNQARNRMFELTYHSSGWRFGYYNGTFWDVGSFVVVGKETLEYKTLKIVFNNVIGRAEGYVYDADGREYFIGAKSGIDIPVGANVYPILFTYTGANGVTVDARFEDYMHFTPNNYIWENFDSYSNGSNLNGQGGWTVVDSPTYGTVTVSNAQSVSSPNSVLINKNTTSGNLAPFKDFSSASNSTVIFEANIRLSQTNVPFDLRLIQTGVAVRTVVNFHSNGNIYASWTGMNLQSYSANTWYHLKVVADTQRGKYDVYINGVLKTTDYSFETAGAQIDRLQMVALGATAGTIYVDNVQVYNEFKTIAGLTAAGATSSTWNTAGEAVGTKYLVRVRAYRADNKNWGAWDYSDNVFSLVSSKIQGYVKDNDGNFVAYAKVEMQGKDETWTEKTTTDSSGYFIIGDLEPAKTYILRAQKTSPMYVSQNTVSVVTKTNSEITWADDLLLRKAGKLKGKIYLETPDAPLAGVQIKTLIDNIEYYGQSDAGGNYQFLLPEGQVLVWVGYRMYDGGETKEAIITFNQTTTLDFNLGKDFPAAMMGKVYDSAGNLVKDAAIVIDGEYFGYIDETGSYYIPGLPGGYLYSVEIVRNDGYYYPSEYENGLVDFDYGLQTIDFRGLTKYE